MKQETNNEIDLLLRRLSRRQDADLHLETDHLDADELSSYAENSLPAVARARYTEHLADCSSCRELVVQLSTSAGVVAAAEASRVHGPSGLRKFLASLFSPMVLRYAVPALGLIVVAVIGFTIFRRDRAETFVAQLEDKQGSSAARAIEEQKAPAAVPESQPQKLISPGITSDTRANRTKEEPQPTPPSAPPAGSETAEAKKDAPVKQAEPQPVASAAPAQPAPKPSETQDEISRFEAEARKQQNVQGRAAPASAQEKQSPFVAEKSQDLAIVSSSPSKAKLEASRGAQTGGATSNLQRDRSDKDDAEIRSVAGRRFRKQRGIWVDTAYEADSATVNLTRGSEQYRALVADEPAIKTIADQLDGQIVVVWKGRAYRIQ